MNRQICHNRMGMARMIPPYPAILRRRANGSSRFVSRNLQLALTSELSRAMQYGSLRKSTSHGYRNQAGIIMTPIATAQISSRLRSSRRWSPSAMLPASRSAPLKIFVRSFTNSGGLRAGSGGARARRGLGRCLGGERPEPGLGLFHGVGVGSGLSIGRSVGRLGGVAPGYVIVQFRRGGRADLVRSGPGGFDTARDFGTARLTLDLGIGGILDLLLALPHASASASTAYSVSF